MTGAVHRPHLNVTAPRGTGDALVARGLTVRRGPCEVIDRLDLRIPAARWTSVVGPNGAGKSTLLQGLAGLLPVEGQCELRGRPLPDWPARERARTLAWLGQGEPVVDDLSVHDVALLGRLPHQPWLGAPSAEDLVAVQHALRQTQAWEWRSRPMGQLSGGERQRVLLARALAVQAPVLLMDEPLLHLDPPHQADWLALVRACVAEGGTVVSVLHELTLALRADDLIVMARGRVLHHGACGDAATHAALIDAFDGRVAVRPLDGHWVALPK